MRRYTKPKPSSGTRIPPAMRLRVRDRDALKAGGCVAFGRLPDDCYGALELDHIRASGGVGMKSVTCDCNLASLCAFHHRYKTVHGREARPVLLEYLAQFGYSAHSEGHLTEEHMDPVVASYLVKVTVRGKDGTTAIPIDALTETIENAIDGEYAVADPHAVVVVNATAERTDI